MVPTNNTTTPHQSAISHPRQLHVLPPLPLLLTIATFGAGD